MLQFRAGLRIPSAALEERRDVDHDEAKTVQNRPSDGNALEPRAGVIHGLAVLGKVHQQQGNGGTDNSCDGGDGKLEDLENELESDGFLRIQKSYLVNMAHIKKLNYDKVVLSNGEELPVSQKRYAQIKIQYLGWKNKQWGSAL